MLRYWLLAIRPKTLTVAAVPVLVGTTLGALHSGGLHPWVALAALLGSLLIQVGTNLHNDAADHERGADSPGQRLGPPRATAEGWLTAEQVKRAAFLCFGTAALIGVYLIWVGGWPILLLGVISILAGLAYTGGPWPIAYSGLGELFVLVFFGLVATTGSYYLQTGELSGLALLSGAIIGMPAAAVLVVNNYRDHESDRIVGKNTLAVRMGPRASQLEYAVLMIGPFILLLWLQSLLDSPWMLLPLLVLPWAVFLVRRVYAEAPGPALNRVLAGTAQMQLGLGATLCLALLVSQAANTTA
jgi:1,4-dihydroxy-2-naphthoate octaprenyltransferase